MVEGRLAMYKELSAYLVENGSYVNLLQGKVEVAVRSNIAGYEYFPLGAVRLYLPSASRRQ
jgi:hypothetical protein